MPVYTYKAHTGKESEGTRRLIDTFELDTDRVPEEVKNYFAKKALGIAAGTEAGAAVLGRIAKKLANGGKASDISSADRDAWKNNPANFAQCDEWHREAALAIIARMYDGTYGQESEGAEPRDPLQAKMRQMADAEVRAELAKNNHSVPRKYDAPIKGVVIRDFNDNQPVSMNQLIERRLAGRHAARIGQEAQEALDREKLRVEAVASSDEADL